MLRRSLGTGVLRGRSGVVVSGAAPFCLLGLFKYGVYAFRLWPACGLRSKSLRPEPAMPALLCSVAV